MPTHCWLYSLRAAGVDRIGIDAEGREGHKDINLYLECADDFLLLVEFDEHGDNNYGMDLVPDRVKTEPQFYVYMKQYLAERAEHLAGIASRVGSRAGFLKIMERVGQCMSLLDQDVHSALPSDERRKRPSRFIPYYQKHAGVKRGRIGQHTHTHTHTHTRTHTHTHSHSHSHTYIHTYTRIQSTVHTCIYTHTHIHTHTFTQIHTYTAHN